jgi:hypothetical protein
MYSGGFDFMIKRLQISAGAVAAAFLLVTMTGCPSGDKEARLPTQTYDLPKDPVAAGGGGGGAAKDKASNAPKTKAAAD